MNRCSHTKETGTRRATRITCLRDTLEPVSREKANSKKQRHQTVLAIYAAWYIFLRRCVSDVTMTWHDTCSSCQIRHSLHVALKKRATMRRSSGRETNERFLLKTDWNIKSAVDYKFLLSLTTTVARHWRSQTAPCQRSPVTHAQWLLTEGKGVWLSIVDRLALGRWSKILASM